MKRSPISRRQFNRLAGTAGFAPIALRSAEPLTADVVVKRIQTELGGDWPETGLDGFKAGDPATVIKGVATTAMATIDVLKQAARANANLILTYEPTFYGRADARPPAQPPPGTLAAGRGAGRGPGGINLADDPIVKAKREFIEKNGLVVFRLRDHWQARKENDMVTGLAAALGWSKGRVKPDDVVYEIPAARAEQVVAQIRTKLNLRGGVRAVGDKSASIRRVLLFAGSMQPPIMWQRYTEVDMLVAGECREWENTHYAADILTAGGKHAFVTIGRVASEDPGMHACADWLKTVVKEVPCRWIGAGDPYWRPTA